ncbi:MAG: ABC transporter substrate-binding protein [Nitrospinota bacterium]
MLRIPTRFSLTISGLALSLLTAAAPATAAEKVILTQPVDSLSFFPIYVGRIKGFFESEGILLDVKATAGGGPHLTAVLAGKAEFTASPGTYQLNALNSGKKAVAFVDLLRRNIIGMLIHKEAAKKAGIKPGMPLMDRVRRAKGLKVGVTRPGALTDILVRNILARAGLKVPGDVRVLAVGGAATMRAALKNRRIDIMTISTPHPERVISEGWGMWFVNWAAGEDPAIKEFMMASLMATPKLLRERPNLIRIMTRATLRSLRYIRASSVARLTKDMEPFFGKRVSPAALRISIKTVKGAINPTGRMSTEAVRTTFQIMKKGGKLKNLKSIKQSDVWTGKFLP